MGTGIIMGAIRVEAGRSFFIRCELDSDLIAFVTEFAEKNMVMLGSFTVVGALKSAKLGFYDQRMHVYAEHSLTVPQELASCVGNISLKDGEPFVHVHAVLADEDGNVRAGHLLEGRIFAAEVHLTEFLGEKLVRKPDDVTGLSLWDL